MIYNQKASGQWVRMFFLLLPDKTDNTRHTPPTVCTGLSTWPDAHLNGRITNEKGREEWATNREF